MSTYTHDIGQWAADTAHYTHDLQQAPLALRRSSFSSSTASESSLLSDGSHQSSATSFSNSSFTVSEQELNPDLDAGNDFTHGKDFIQQWRSVAQLVEDQSFSEAQNQFNIASPADIRSSHNGTTYSGKLNIPSAHSNWTSSICDKGASVGPTSRKAGSIWDHRAALRQSQSTSKADRETWPVAVDGLPSKGQTNSQKALLHQVGAIRRSCAPDSRVHGSQPVVPISVGTNPRRTSTSRSWCKPSLVRQQERRDDFVLNLVECATQLVSYLWPNATHCPVVTLNFFIQETLRRSRSTYSTLQLTLYYLYLVRGKDRVSSSCASVTQNATGVAPRGMECGRRMFLAALILASKYLQDRNFSTNAWTKITNLPAQEINTNEKIFLSAMGYSLHLPLQKYNDWCNRVQGCVDYATLGLQCPWNEVLREYAASQMSFGYASSATSTPSATFGSAQLSSSPIVADCTNKFGTTTQVHGNHGFTIPSSQNKSERETLNTPSTLSSQAKIPTAPPAPTLDRKLTTPQPSPWSTTGSVSAASATGSFVGCPLRRNIASACGMEAKRQFGERPVPFVSIQQPSIPGSYKAPELVAAAASLATSQATDGDVVMCTNVAEFTCSPISLTGSDETSSQRPRPTIRRGVTSSSAWTTTSAACYFPSPLRSSFTQLPTPPHSSVGTEVIDLATSFDEKSDATEAHALGKARMNLAHRVTLEAQKHGLETMTLPPMKAPKVYESFSDCSSDFQLDTPATSFTDGSSSDTYQTDISSQDTMDSYGLQQSASLPAIAHILRCGLREHLKPVMQGLRPELASDVEAAKTLRSLKRSFSATDGMAAAPDAKVRRVFSCRSR